MGQLLARDPCLEGLLRIQQAHDLDEAAHLSWLHTHVHSHATASRLVRELLRTAISTAHARKAHHLWWHSLHALHPLHLPTTALSTTTQCSLHLS